MTRFAFKNVLLVIPLKLSSTFCNVQSVYFVGSMRNTSSPRQSESGESYIIVSALEYETLSHFFVGYRIDQVITCEKWFLLNKNC